MNEAYIKDGPHTQIQTQGDESPFITIIMPVYNSVKYLDAAVSSVLSQTFQDFELIIVDDCSTDGSFDIACRYAERSGGRIQVIRLDKNAGPSAARNKAIESARGKYIGFMDSDDTIDRDMLEKAAKHFTEHDTDAVIFGITEVYYAKNGELKYVNEIKMPEDRLLDTDGLRECIIQLEELTLYGYTWNKLYRRDIIISKDIRYKKLRLLEDLMFNIDFFNAAKSAYIVSAAPYRYSKRIENSVTSQFVPEYYELHTMKVRKLYEQYEHWGMCNPDVRRVLANIYARYTLSALQRNCDSRAGMSHRDRKSFIKEQYGSPLYRDLIGFCRPENRLIGIFASFYKRKLTAPALMYARLVYISKNALPILFARLKQKN